ncbi:hypothetical protein AXA65_06380 [Chryseobacterium sp. FP211-J200]|nr:hypothetical protein AXA65_06380 [Chryseobacterium sp. FP211-J200]
MPTKNRLSLLINAVNSVLEQTYKNWELIIVNDASTDETKKYLDQLVSKNTRVKVIHHTESLGACVSRNDALSLATGDFITGLDDDDEFKPDRLKIFIDNWEDDESTIGLSAYKSNKIDGIVGETRNDLKPFYIMQDDLLYKNDIGNQVFLRTADLRNINGFDKEYKIWQDFDCWYRLLSNKKKIKKIPFDTYIFEHSERPDRITHSGKKNVMNSYGLFVKKNNLNFRKRNILKFHLLGYGVKNYTIFFYFELVFMTLFDLKTIEKLNNEYLKPLIKNNLKRIGLIK